MWLLDGRMTALNIPEQCGVMLLPDCTLFPHGGLPLHIFEARYRRMLEEAIEGDCLFAVARLLAEPDGIEGFESCVAPVGTIGLVRASREMEDGTSNLLLHGVMRVRFLEWLGGKDYPFVRIEPLITVFTPEGGEGAAMKTLRVAIENAIQDLPEAVQQGVFTLLDRAEEPGLMTDIVSQQFVNDPDLRQQLLEMPSAGARIPLICEYLRKAREGA
jgi:Lon protease-like protein